MSNAAAAVDNEFDDVVQVAASSGSPPPKLRRKWVNADVDGSHVSAVAWGKGSPQLVLLHGAGESARRFDRVGLASTRPLVAIDLPGHGQSSWRRDARYRPEQLAASVAAAIRSFVPSAGAVVGAGLGGLVAIAVAVRYPLQVRNLVLVDTFPSVDPAGEVPKDLPASFGTQEELLSLAPRLSTSAGRSDVLLRSELSHNSRQREDGRWVLRHDLSAVNPAWGASDAEPLWADLSKITAPLLVVFSARSKARGIIPDELRVRVPRAQVLDLRLGINVPGNQGDIFDDGAVELLAAADQFVATAGTGSQTATAH